MSNSSTASVAPKSQSKALNVGLWILQILGAAMFLMAGFGKLSGAEMHVKTFEAIGFGQWFRYVTGAIEVGAAVMLLIPRLSGIGAILLVCTMLGAIATHLFVIGGSVAMPVALLVVMALVAYGRRRNTLQLFGR